MFLPIVVCLTGVTLLIFATCIISDHALTGAILAVGGTVLVLFSWALADEAYLDEAKYKCTTCEYCSTDQEFKYCPYDGTKLHLE